MWYYAINNQQLGPVDEARMKELLADGTITSSTLVWSSGMGTWQPLSQTPLGGATSLSQSQAITPPVVTQPEVENLNKLFTWTWITLVASLVTFGISLIATVVLFLVIVYKSWQLVQDGNARTTPDQAVAFSFIPAFQFWWWFVAFRDLAKELNRVMIKEQINGERVNEDIALWFVICLVASPLVFPLLPALVLGVILAGQYRTAASAIILHRQA